MKKIILVDLIIMLLLALLFAEWRGIFVVEGILGGVALAFAATVDQRRGGD